MLSTLLVSAIYITSAHRESAHIYITSAHTETKQSKKKETEMKDEINVMKASDFWIGKKRNVAYGERLENLIDNGLENKTARKKTNELVIPEPLKVVKRLNTKSCEKRDNFIDISNGDFVRDETLEAAINKRKFLLELVIKQYSFFEEKNRTKLVQAIWTAISL